MEITENGLVIWFTGLSGSGKTTTALQLKNSLEVTGQKVVVLDGDQIRSGLSRDLGFDAQSREENNRRVAEVAKNFSRPKNDGNCLDNITYCSHQRYGL